jgi:hypothetical protein
MAEEKKEPWLNYLALTTVVFAVCATLSTLKGGAFAEKIKRYDDEKAEIKTTAEDLERKRDDAQRHSASFGTAAMFLQVAILLSFVSALMKRNTSGSSASARALLFL